MSNDDRAMNQVSAKYGWPGPARVEQLEKAQKFPATKRVRFQGREIDINRQVVPIGLPKYRLRNGRTTSLQEEYRAENPDVQEDYFSKDSERDDVQEVQHKLLIKLADNTAMQKLFSNPSNRQSEEIILTYDGFVLNGNRRLAFWRQLIYENNTKYQHFGNIEIVRLPSGQEQDLDKLEAELQIVREIKEDYSWHAEANMMMAKKREYNYTDSELANLYDMKVSEVALRFNILELAIDYLKSRDWEGRWSRVEGKELGFEQLAKLRKGPAMRMRGDASQQLFASVVFCLLDSPDTLGRRVYSVVQDCSKHFDPVIKQLKTVIEVDSDEQDETEDELFGGDLTPEDNRMAKINEKILYGDVDSESVRGEVLETIEAARNIEKETDKAAFLLNQCQKAHDDLNKAVQEGLNNESDREGVEAQLEEVEAKIKTIREFLKRDANN
ncbi:hypothetical protein FIM12_03810 [SAR202 cluster bacterium AD-804-J14_MRT_500m]|nr:hypothetical protein [SAR202 cluster bacterium AD-804-J14_MRT_500m]